MYTFRDFSDTVAPLLRGRSFCGVACARAYLLETMEMFESAWIGDVVGDAEAVASALRIAYFYSATEK